MSESPREQQARQRSESRRIRQRDLLRPIGLALMAIVAISAANGAPAPGLHGAHAAVSVALGVYLLGLAVWMTDDFIARGFAAQLAMASVLGTAGVAIVALQPGGASSLGASAAVWVAVTRLQLRAGVTVGALITLSLVTANVLNGISSGGVLSSALLCVLLGLTAHFIKESRESQARTELLLAELEDARDDLAEAAAAGERARIAGELHDVLAHSLSGAAIQLQGARLLAERGTSEPQLQATIARASELVKDGLAEARGAVGALHGDPLPTVEQLDVLVESFRRDMHVRATLTVEGNTRKLSPETSLALYRGAQEALTNVARHAPRAATAVVLRYEPQRTVLSIEDSVAGVVPITAFAPMPESANGLAHVGGGRGLEGMRERVERAGGRLHAGPTDDGWRVQLELPA
jgi:signal transduction histidine kinase